MSVDTSVYMKAPGCSLSEMASQVSTLLRVDLRRAEARPDECFATRVMGLEFRLLYREGIVDDPPMAFTQYTHCLDMDILVWPGDEGIFNAYRRSVADFLARIIHRDLGYSTMAVDDSQRLLWSSERDEDGSSECKEDE